MKTDDLNRMTKKELECESIYLMHRINSGQATTEDALKLKAIYGKLKEINGTHNNTFENPKVT